VNGPAQNQGPRATNCPAIAPLLPFYACDELNAAERGQVDAHLAQCAACGEQLKQERRLLEALDEMLQPADRLNPSDTLLAQCRSELAERLDDLASPPAPEHWQPFGWLRRLIALRPALGGALLVFFGVVLGAQVPSWVASLGRARTADPTVNVRATPRLTEDQLAQMSVAGINFVPSSDAAPGTVQVELRAEQPLIISGSVEDGDVRRVLTYVIENGHRFDAGVRLDCLDALKSHTTDADVRRALLGAARRDENPAVRLKALDALRDSAEQPAVRQALLDSLEHESNPGVRVEAVNLLVHSLRQLEENSTPALAPVPASPRTTAPKSASLPTDPSVERVVRALEELTRKDPSRYVRLRSAAALRQIGPREVQ